MKKIFIIFTAVLAASVSSTAQQLSSAYFMESYKFRHDLNPAFASSRSYFSLALGDINADISSNMGIGTFLYPTPSGQLTTFMNGSVSSEEFMKNLNKNNLLGVDANIKLFSTGIWGKKGFTSVEFGIKSSTASNLPKDLFAFMKNVGQSETYNISNLSLRTRNYFELAIGHSHNITERLNIGVKVKLLLGIVSAQAKIDNMKIQMDRNQWRIEADGSFYANVPTLNIPTKAGSQELDLQNISFDMGGENSSPAAMISNLTKGLGYGGAIDLGASYEVIDGLTVSAAILDLGIISWGSSISGHTSNDPWVFEGFDNISVNGGENDQNSISSQFEAMGKDFVNFVKFYKDDSRSNRLEMLSATLNLAAEYKLPFYRKLSFGALYSNRFASVFSNYEGRLFVNLHPVKWFELSTNYGISNLGSMWGAALSFDFPGIGIFLGTDNLFMDVTPPLEGVGIGLPYKNTNVSVNFGLTFNISKIRRLGDWRDDD